MGGGSNDGGVDGQVGGHGRAKEAGGQASGLVNPKNVICGPYPCASLHRQTMHTWMGKRKLLIKDVVRNDHLDNHNKKENINK